MSRVDVGLAFARPDNFAMAWLCGRIPALSLIFCSVCAAVGVDVDVERQSALQQDAA